jgi:hypothetical protein
MAKILLWHNSYKPIDLRTFHTLRFFDVGHILCYHVQEHDFDFIAAIYVLDLAILSVISESLPTDTFPAELYLYTYPESHLCVL